MEPAAGGTEKQPSTDGKKKNEALDWFIHIAIAIILGVLIVTFVAQRTIVYDISMQPNFVEGDNLLVEKLGYRFGDLHRGDIVIVKMPDTDRKLIKRLVAVEGDRVQVKDGKLYVNGKQFLIGLPVEPETPVGDLPEYTDLTLKKGQAYVLGDNRPYSQDCTEFGPIQKDEIVGRAVFRFYPFSKFGPIRYTGGYK
ncbi:MAG TPA: signal peptidase I [Clostridia bacterium]|nr:signal peptidase I [Clostridia bacterium]